MAAAATKKRKFCHNAVIEKTQVQTFSIPNDIIVEILSWVPGNSLLRLRWACKYWFDLISRNPDFVHMHLHRSTSTTIHPHNPSVLISSPISPEDCKFLQKFTMDPYPPCMFFQSYIDSTTGFFSCREKLTNIYDFRILGSCNGLLFFSYTSTKYSDIPNTELCIWHSLRENTELCIWNPCTKEYRHLPKPPLDYPTTHHSNFGFGYDRSIDDYKVIINVFASTTSFGLSSIQVYTLGTNSWRSSIGSIAACNLHPCICDNLVFMNGALYCIDESCERILSFDIEKEMYEEISNQPECLHGGLDTRALEIFEGSLCLILSTTSNVEMWMLKESSWTMLLKIQRARGNLLGNNVKPLRLAKNGKIMLFDMQKHNAVYDPKESRSRTINRTAENEEYMLHRGEQAEAVYIESLVSLNSGTYWHS